MASLTPRCSLWIEAEGKKVLCEDTYRALKAIAKYGDVEEAARMLGTTPGEILEAIRRAEEALGHPLVSDGEITGTGQDLLKTYERYREVFDLCLKRPYKVPSVAVDAVIIRDRKILLIKRGHEPFANMYALPGGFVEYGERVEEALRREVQEETGLRVLAHHLIGVYSDPHRDPRWHTISIAYLVRCEGNVAAGDDAAEAKWFDLDALPSLAFDHGKIIEDALSLLSRLDCV